MCLDKKRAREETGLRRSASQRDLVRSNSSGNLSAKNPNASRHSANPADNKLTQENTTDVSVIGVFSREASLRFGKEWKNRMLNDSTNHATKLSKDKVNVADRETLLSRQSRMEVSTDFEKQVNTLFDKKMIPHVIVVIEGAQEASTLSLRKNIADDDIGLGYSRTDYIQGSQKGGKNDDRQSMSIYVRDDMKNVYSFTQEEIPREKGGSIKAVGINYKTADGTNYRSLAVHIPNDYAKREPEYIETIKAFKTYADAATLKGVTVTGYLGDTNYRSPVYDNTVPSLGGRTAEGNTLNPQSSSDKNSDTNFMQHVPLGGSNEKHKVLQPSTLNYIFPVQEGENNTATDHPSMIAYTAHAVELFGRTPDGNSAYYKEV